MYYTLGMLDNEKFGFAQNDKAPEKEPELAKQEEKKVEVKPYKVFGQDFSLLNPEIIDYYKTRMKMMAIKYKLVGRVNNSGQYQIRDDVRYDLVKMEKEIEENAENYYKAMALYMKKHFIFNIKIEQMEDGRGKASLYLSEYIDNFLGLEYVVSHIADYIDVFDDEFRIKVRKAFNLVDVATKVDDFAVPNLAVVMQDCFDLELVVGGLYDMASQIYVMRLLKALEEAGPAGAEVTAKYRELLAGSKDIEINEKFRYTSYKALLDRAIDELGGYEKLPVPPETLQSIMKDINGTVRAIDNAAGRAQAVEIELPKAEDKKAVSGKSGSKGGKSAGGGQGGNKNGSSAKPPKTEKKTEKKADNNSKTSGGADLDWMNQNGADAVEAGERVLKPFRDAVKKARDARRDTDREAPTPNPVQDPALQPVIIPPFHGAGPSNTPGMILPGDERLAPPLENASIGDDDVYDLGQADYPAQEMEVEAEVEITTTTVTDANGRVIASQTEISAEVTVTERTAIKPPEQDEIEIGE